MKDFNIQFAEDKFEKLIIQIGWNSLGDWINFWESKKSNLLIDKFWNYKVNDDWIWGLALPLLSQAIKYKKNYSDRKIIGISALPGTGKTTLGKWLEKISYKFDFKIAVISIDDFYLPSEDMKSAIENNPWNVSRGFPGTHSVNLMHDKLNNWKNNGKLEVPIFDKSLRNGLGDRSHWRSDVPDILILEGWFLGVKQLTSENNVNLSTVINDNNNFKIPLSSDEIIYRQIIQKNLNEYLGIWNLLDDIWHIKPIKFEYLNLWKSNQEREMLLKKGNALKNKNLSDFLRMLNVSIPHTSFDNINSDFLLLINQDRKVIEVGLNRS